MIKDSTDSPVWGTVKRIHTQTTSLSEYAHQMWTLQNYWSSHLALRQKLFECVQLLNFTMRKLSSWSPGVNLSCVLFPSFRIIWLTCCKHLDGLTGTFAKLVFLFPIGKNTMQSSESQRLNRISEALLYKPCVRLVSNTGKWTSLFRILPSSVQRIYYNFNLSHTMRPTGLLLYQRCTKLSALKR